MRLKTSAWLIQPQKVTAFSIPRYRVSSLEPTLFRAISNYGEVSQVAPQKGSSGAQGKIARFPGNQASDENQLKFTAPLRP